jgi:hypothetical protein
MALSISIALIGGALLYRFIPTKEIEPSILAIDQNSYQENFEDIIADFTTPLSDDITPPSTEPLTNTGLVGQQLIMDYIGLTASGEVATNDIVNLANRRAEDIATLHTFQEVRISDIKIIPDNAANARNYASEFSKIYSDYKWEMSKVSSDAEAMATLYEKMSNALKDLPVPTSVSGLHLDLVNNHASTAAGLKTTKEVETDPVKVLAGMVAIKENVLKEASALAEISHILREKYGSI